MRRLRKATVGTCWLVPVVLLVAAGVSGAACAGLSPPPPEWYSSPPPCAACYTGAGEGSSYADARRKALGSLCDSIKTTVSSEFASKETHHLRQNLREGLENAQVDYEQAVDVMVTTSSRCTFEGVPYKEEPRPERVGEKHYVRLVLSARAYADFLASRRTGFRLDTGETELLAETRAALLAASSRCLTAQGYLPAKTQTEKLAYVLEMTVRPTVSDSGLEDLKGANTTPAMRLVHTSTGRIEWQVSLAPIKTVGFDQATVLRRLGEAVVKKVEEQCNSLR